MLKKIAFLLAACVVMATGCTDEEAGPIINFDGGLALGAFPRLQQLDFAEFDLADLQGSVYQHTVDFVDGNGSQDISEYRILVAFDDNNPDNGDNSTDFAVWDAMTVDVQAISDVDPETGNKVYTLTIPFSAAANFVGVAPEDVISGDRFQFRTELLKTDGRVFNSVNSTPAVTNAFRGIWNWNVNATCPLPDDFFSGSYTMSYLDGDVYPVVNLFGRPVQAYGPPELSREVSFDLVSGATTVRTVTTEWLSGTNLARDVTLTFTFSCDIIEGESSGTTINCAGGGWGSRPASTSSLDLTDDSGFSMEWFDFGTDLDGTCGIGERSYTLNFQRN